MKRIEKMYALGQLIRHDYKCLIEPANPFSLDNPDAFVYKDNVMYAVYIPTFAEKKNLDHLLRRLYVSQLSCGMMFVPLLLWNEEDEIAYSALQCMENTFAHVAYSMEDVMAYVDKDEKMFRKWRNFSRLQQRHYLNYQRRMDFSMENSEIRLWGNENLDIDDDGIRFDVARDNLSWSEQGRTWYTNKYYRSDYGDLAKCPKRNMNSFKDVFQEVMTMSFKNMYLFSDGFVEANDNTERRLRVVDTDWNLFSHEALQNDGQIERMYPNKYYSMLSFVGMTPLKMRKTNDIAEFSDKYATMYEEFNRKKHR